MYSHEKYLAHLRSDYWRKTVRRAIHRRVYSQYGNLCCERCGIAEVPFEIHHKTYGYLFCEMAGLHTLANLCVDCHRCVHGKGPDPRTFKGLHQLIKRL